MTVLTDVPLLSLSLSWVTWRRAEGDRVESGPRNLPCQSSSMTIPLRRPTRLPSTSARNAPPPWQVCKREPTLTAYFSSDEKGRARTDANTVSGGSASVSPSIEDYSAQANQIAYETFSLVPEMTAAASVASGEQPYGPARRDRRLRSQCRHHTFNLKSHNAVSRLRLLGNDSTAGPLFPQSGLHLVAVHARLHASAI